MPHTSVPQHRSAHLVVFPLIVRGLFGEAIESLQAEVEPHVGRTVAFFLAACREGATC